MVFFCSGISVVLFHTLEFSMTGLKQRLLIYLRWLGLDLVLSVAWSFGVQLMVFFCSGISVVLFHTLGFSGCHNTFLSSPHL